ncbi:hypothetical protein HYW75_04795 [Candidatus Pacearchaeota archaeon]|nr:hypothetical protein [Candidatus Pacearchaeota archaeon]
MIKLEKTLRKVIKRKGYLELERYEIAYRDPEQFKLVLDGEIHKNLLQINMNNFDWYADKVYHYFMESAIHLQDMNEELINILARKEKWVDYSQKMNGIQFMQISKELPIVWNEYPILASVQIEGEIPEIVKVSSLPNQVPDKLFSRHMKKEIIYLINTPSDFNDPAQLERYTRDLQNLLGES